MQLVIAKGHLSSYCVSGSTLGSLCVKCKINKHLLKERKCLFPQGTHNWGHMEMITAHGNTIFKCSGRIVENVINPAWEQLGDFTQISFKLELER